jgi:phage tail-like protein
MKSTWWVKMTRTEIEQLLPEILRRTSGAGTVLHAILGVMEGLHVHTESRLAHIDQLFNPYDTDPQFVPYLATWLDLERFFDASDGGATTRDEPITSGSGRLRELIARAAYLSKWRGTGHGLRAFLETATGATGFEIEERPAVEHAWREAFHIRVRVPAWLVIHQALIARIVESEKPAYVTVEILYENGRAAAPYPGENEYVSRV